MKNKIMVRPLFREIAAAVEARLTCIKQGKEEWKDRHEQRILELVKSYMPSGSGWDMGTRIDLDRSTGEKLVFFGSYHHMDQAGGYDGWTEHTIHVTPSLISRMSLRITGRNRNEIKDYLYQTFDQALEYDLGPTIEYDRLISKYPAVAAAYELKAKWKDGGSRMVVQVAGFDLSEFPNWDEARLWAIERLQERETELDTLAQANR